MTKSISFLPFDMIKSVDNLFQDKSISTKIIADECDLTVPYVSTLRQGKRDLEKTSFETLKKLYWFATNRHVDVFYREEQELKGKYDSVSLSLNVSKLIVSFNDKQLFYHGIINPFCLIDNQEGSISIPRSIFIDKRGHQIDPEIFGHSFNCGYGGTGPNNLVHFLEKYSPYSRIDLEQFIFSNKNIVYDFSSKKLSSFDSTSCIDPVSIDIIGQVLNFTFPGKTLFDNNFPTNNQILNKIQSLLNLLTEKFKIDCSPISLKFMKKGTNQATRVSVSAEKHNFILKFRSFQIQFYLDNVKSSQLVSSICDKLHYNTPKQLGKSNIFSKQMSVEEYVF